MAFEKIVNTNTLREICSGPDVIEGFIHFGVARSSKRLFYDNEEKTWWMYNEIDDSEETLTDTEFEKSTVAKAVREGAFFLY